MELWQINRIKELEKNSQWGQAGKQWRLHGKVEHAQTCEVIAEAISKGNEVREKIKNKFNFKMIEPESHSTNEEKERFLLDLLRHRKLYSIGTGDFNKIDKMMHDICISYLPLRDIQTNLTKFDIKYRNIYTK